MRALLTFDYPGNVRELGHLVQRAVVMAQGPVITRQDLPTFKHGQPQFDSDSELQYLLALPLEQATRNLERLLITRALERAQGNKAEAARLLGIHRQYLYTKLKELAIDNDDSNP